MMPGGTGAGLVKTSVKRKNNETLANAKPGKKGKLSNSPKESSKNPQKENTDSKKSYNTRATRSATSTRSQYTSQIPKYQPRNSGAKNSEKSDSDSQKSPDNLKKNLVNPENQADWTTPSKKKTSPKSRAINSSPTVNTSNRFATLSNQMETVVNERDTNVSDGNSEQRTKGQQPERQTPGQRPPPIHVAAISLKDVASLITTTYPEVKNQFYLKQSQDKKYITITTINIEHYNTFKALFNIKGLEFYTFTPKSDKPKTIVLKGLYGDFTDYEIKKEFDELKLKNVKILKITKTFFRKNSTYYVYLVQISSDSILSELTNIKSILYQKIHWEQLRKSELFQCRKCQRFGHYSGNCSMAFRCVKCSLSHDQGQCELDKNADRELLTCANCGKTGHPANYKGCEHYKRELIASKSIIENKNQKLNSNIAQISKKLNPQVSFSETVKSNPTSTNVNNKHIHQSVQQKKIVQRTNTPINDTNNQNDPQTRPQWANDLKSEIISAFAAFVNPISDQVEVNKNNIELIMNHLKINGEQNK